MRDTPWHCAIQETEVKCRRDLLGVNLQKAGDPGYLTASHRFYAIEDILTSFRTLTIQSEDNQKTFILTLLPVGEPR